MVRSCWAAILLAACADDGQLGGDAATRQPDAETPGGGAVIATGICVVSNLALDDMTVYWSDGGCEQAGAVGYSGGGIGAVAKQGGAPRTLASESGGASGVHVLGDQVYWAAGLFPAAIRSVPVAGGVVTTLWSSDAGPNAGPGGIAVDNDSVYWVQAVSGSVWRVPRLGGVSVQLVLASGFGFAMAGDQSDLYWTRQGPYPSYSPDGLQRMSKAGGAPAQVAPGPPSEVLVLDATTAYEIQQWHQIVAIQKHGGASAIVDDLGAREQAGALAVDDTSIFVTTNNTDSGRGRVVRVPKMGGPEVVLAEHSHSLGPLAVDPQFIYYATSPTVAGQVSFPDATIVRISR